MRTALGLVVALVLTMSSATSGWAQDGSPTATGPSVLSGLGLPELRIQLADGAIQVPEQVDAGLVLLVVENSLEFPSGVSFIQPPEGSSIDEVLGILGPPPAASPEAGAAPEGGEEMGPPPPLFYEMTWAGGAFAPPGGEAEVALTLTPGEWLVASDPESGLAPVTLTVGEGTTTETPEVPADATITMDDYQFQFPDEVAAGQQVWEVTNEFDQPHEMFIVRTPRRLTVDEVNQILTLEEDAELPPGLPNPAEFQDLGGVAPISEGQTVYVEMNLEPGAYAAVCFIPDQESGMPHAFKGMVTVFEIGEDGQQVDPPASPEPDEHDAHDAAATPES